MICNNYKWQNYMSWCRAIKQSIPSTKSFIRQEIIKYAWGEWIITYKVNQV